MNVKREFRDARQQDPKGIALKAMPYGAFGKLIAIVCALSLVLSLNPTAAFAQDATSSASSLSPFAGLMQGSSSEDEIQLAGHIEEDEYTVTFDLNGGTYESETTHVFTGVVNKSYVVPAGPTKDKYTFVGWASDADAETAEVSAGDTMYIPDSNKTYYAIWKEKTGGTVHLFANGGKFENDKETMDVEATYGEAAEYGVPVREGYSFAGWVPDGGDAGKLSFLIKITEDNDGKTYNAYWVAGAACVTFIATGVESESMSKHCAGSVGDPFTVPADPVRDGYTFLGWYSGSTKFAGAAGSESQFVAGDPQVYFSKWEKNPTKLTLHYNYGEPETTVDASGQVGDYITVAAPTRIGYDFQGWSTNKDATTGETNLKFPSPMSDGTAIDYYAIWKIQQHSITLKGMGGTWSDGYDYRVYTADGGSKVEFSEEPSRDGYTFTGFYEQPNGEGTQLEIDDDGNITIPISEDTTWYADWQAGAGLLRFNANGGKFAPGEDDDPDDPPSEKDVEPSFGTYVNYPTPTREGYAFIGWVLDADSESETPVYTIQLTKDNNDSTYYAKWISSIAAVSFVATDADNADVCNVMRTGNFGSTFEIPADAQKAGYTFEGWFTKPNGGGAKLAEAAGETKKFSELDPYVYYAHFINNNIKVTLEANNGTYSDGTASQEIAGQTDAEVHYSVPTRAGYTFVGWNKSGDATDTADAPCTSIAFPSENATYKASWTADSAKVTFIAAGAEVLENDATTGGAVKDYIGVTDGAVTYGTMTAKKDGYIFNGWSKTPDGAVVDSMPATFAPGNNTYYAVFTSEDVKVTFNANGGEIDGSDSKEITGKFDGAVDVEAPVREGYTFVGWANSPTAAIAEAKTDLTYGYDIAVNNAQLYAVWSANNMSVTYEANGGKFKVGEEQKDAVTLTGGAETTYTKPADPQREGYELASWNTMLNGKGTDVTDVVKFPTDKDATYYAQWKKKKYKLTLDGNGGRVGSATTAAMEGEFDNTVEYEVPTRAGYAFMGWSESGAEADANYQIRYTEGTKDKTLKAVWKPASANVVFVAYGANEDVTTSIPGKVGEKFTVPADPARTGYIFDGWYTERDGGTRLDGEAGTEIEFASTTPAIYYAHFKDNKTTLTLHYNDGTTSAEDVTGIEGEIVPYKEVTRAGYTFKGWATKENPADKDLLGIQPVYPASAGSGMKIDWYAVWQQDQVTLTFSAQGGAFKDTGKEVATVDTVTDGAYALPTAPRRTGYTFDGWYTETNGQGERVPDAPTAPTSNAVYFAKWVGDQINLNLDPNGGGFSDSTSSAAEVASLDTNVITKSGEYLSQVSYELPKRAGYQFLGWNESGTAEEELVMSLSIPASEKTYKAVWEPHDITITYDAPEGKVVLSEGDNPSSKSDESVSFDGKTDNQVNFTVPTAEKEGYDFLGWTATAGSKEIASKPTNYPTQNATYYAAFRKEQITLKFDANGGTIYDKSSATYTDQYGFTVDYETPKRTGYYFTGWSTKEDGSTGTNLNYAYGKGDAVNGTTFYAQWSAFPEDLSKQLLDTKNELATAKAESSNNAQKVESANAEVERLTTENATLVEQSQGVVISGGGGNSTSEGDSGSDGAGSVQEKTRTVYTSGSDYGNTNAAASENNDEINIWNFWEQGPVYLVSFWIGFMVLSFVCAGLAFAFRKRWLKEHNLVDGLSKNSPNGGLKE